jgi:hypothetical protein
MPQVYDPNQDVRDSQQRLVSPRINVSLLPTTIAVGVTAVLLPTNSRANRTFILVQNQGSNPVFLGDASVTISNGYQLNPFSDITIPCTDQAVVYAVCSQAGNNVSVLEGV